MKRRYKITEADLSSESSIHSFFNKLSEEEKKSWKKLLKECIDENPRIKRNVRFYKFLLGFGGVIIIVSILTGIADLLVFPAVAALGTSLDKRTFNEIRECVKRKKEMQKNTEEDLPSTDDQPVQFIDESKRKKVIRLTESDLMKIVKKVIKEDEDTYINKMAKPWRRLAGINLENPGDVEDYDVSDQELSDISNTLNSLENEINDDPELLGWQRDRLLDNLAFVKDYLEQRKTHGKDF